MSMKKPCCRPQNLPISLRQLRKSAQNRAEGPEGDKIKKKCAQKFHSEAETANQVHKTAGVAVHVMKTMLQAAKSGFSRL